MATTEIEEMRGLVNNLRGELVEVQGLVAQVRRDVQEFHDLVEPLPRTLDLIMRSLGKCQSRCHVDNPPGRWRGLGRALASLFRAGSHQQITVERTNVE
jgi:hypothetical protein